jgi:hypothetical protein
VPGEVFRLITVPADYFGVSTTPYLEGLRSVLRPEIVVMWTGVLVVSPTISCVEANGYAQAIGRKPLLWDNFPVNDYAPYKLMVGPYKGRAADLPDCLLGITSNPANQVKANRIPLRTVADYLNDPAGYDPEASWESSLLEFAGSAAGRETLGHFIENVRSTALDRTESVRFAKLSDDFVAALDGPDWPGAHEALRQELEAENAAPTNIETIDPELAGELDCELPLQSPERVCVGSWLDRLVLNVANGLAATAALVATRPDVAATFANGLLTGTARPPAATDAAHSNVADLVERRSDDASNANVHGDRFYFALGPTYVLENRMDRYLALALARATAYVPLSPVASSSVTVEVNGAAVPTNPDGSFSVPVGGSEAVVVVTDGARQRTRRTFNAPD